MKLSPSAFEEARRFLRERGRDLERTRFAFHFEGGTAARVLESLAAFQNADGGFGRGLEPDLRLPDSSAYATSVGLQVLREVGETADCALVQRALHYLVEGFDVSLERWVQVPDSVDQAPHAPWWGYDAKAAAAKGFRPNPSAELAGYLWQWSAGSTDLRERTLKLALGYLASHDDPLEMHDLLCYGRLLESTELPAAAREEILPRLLADVLSVVATDPAAWGGYGCRPLWVAPAPDAPLASCLEASIATHLDFEIEHQGGDGAWTPFWTWGGAYPDVWPIAEREWKGVLTLKTLRSLRAFDRLEAS